MPHLIEFFRENPDHEHASARALRSIEVPAVSALSELFLDPDENVQVASIQALGAIGPVAREAERHLRPFRHSPFTRAGREAEQALKKTLKKN